jgi:hypothetical protein
MNSTSDRQRLLEDSLPPPAFADSLAATRRAARNRRFRLGVMRTLPVVALVSAAAWIFGAGFKSEKQSAERPAESKPAYVLVTNNPSAPLIVLRTSSPAAGLVVKTDSAPVTITKATPEELFASAGSRPAGLVQLANGTTRWMWLDAPELE